MLLHYLDMEHEIGVEMNTKKSKNILDIIDCNLKKDD